MFISCAKPAGKNVILPMAISWRWVDRASQSLMCPLAVGWDGNAWRMGSAMISSSLLDLDWPEEAVPNRRGNQGTAQISARAKVVSSSLCFIAFPILFNHSIAYFFYFFSVTRNPFLGNLSGGTGVIRCTDYTYCCEGDDNCHCGNRTNLVIFQAGTSAFTLISGTTADPQSAAASTTAGSLSQTLPVPNSATTTYNAANAIPQTQSNSSKNVTKIAVGIGVPFGVVIIGVIASLILWRQRRRKQAMGQSQASWAPAFPETAKVPQPPSDLSSPYLSSHTQQQGVVGSRGFEPAEMQQPRNPQELENSSPSTAQRPLEVSGSSLWAGNSPSAGSDCYSSTERVPSPMQPRPG